MSNSFFHYANFEKYQEEIYSKFSNVVHHSTSPFILLVVYILTPISVLLNFQRTFYFSPLDLHYSPNSLVHHSTSPFILLIVYILIRLTPCLDYFVITFPVFFILKFIVSFLLSLTLVLQPCYKFKVNF